eukprot:9534816-Prorocentrum_lima.AAC.1
MEEGKDCNSKLLPVGTGVDGHEEQEHMILLGSDVNKHQKSNQGTATRDEQFINVVVATNTETV